MISDLQTFCDKIIERRRTDATRDVPCILCPNSVAGYGALQQHLFSDHNVVLQPLDDVENVDGLLAAVRAAVCGDSGSFTCMRCGLSTDNLSGLEKHLSAFEGFDRSEREKDCRMWTAEFLPSLRPFVVFSAAMNEDAADEEEEENFTANGAQEGPEAGEEGPECAAGVVECPYCILRHGGRAALSSTAVVRFSSDQYAEHLCSAHGISDFHKLIKTFSAAKTDAEPEAASLDFHGRIELVNIIRELTDNGLDLETGARFDTATSTPLACVPSAEVYKNLKRDAPNEEHYLIPSRVNDALITFLLQVDSDDEDDIDDEDFPMVKPIVETLAQQ